MLSNNKIAQVTKELLDDQEPAAWVSWLFTLQNSLIANGSTASLSKKGSMELSAGFAALKNFFTDLHDLQKK